MKSMKKFLALALALALCFAMALPAMATEGTPGTTPIKETLTLENPTPGHTYTVYQIFTGTIGKDADGEAVLANIKYGQNFGGFDLETLHNVGEVVDSAVVDKIAGDGFAVELLNALRDKENPYKTTGRVAEDAETLKIEVDTGYYLIVDNGHEDDPAPAGDKISALIVQVVGPTSIKTKTTDTTMEKTVQTYDKSKFTDDAGHTIGESFQFKLEAKIPVTQLTSFDKYMIRFKDTMSDGLTFEKIDSVKVENGGEITAKTDDKAGYVFLYTDENYSVEDNQDPEDKAGVSFTVEIANLFDFIGEDNWPIVTEGEGDSAVKYVKVVLTYSAHLNEDALVMGTGTDENGEELTDSNANKNTGSLDFTRKPDGEGFGTTTPDDTYVFTLKLNGTKYKDSVDPNNLLDGAGFTVYTVKTEGGKDLKDKPIIFKKVEGKGWVYDKVDETEGGKGTEIITGTDGMFVFNGLGPGKYILSETKVPEGGYNRSADILIQVTEENKDEISHIISCSATMKYIGNEDVTDEDAEKQNNGEGGGVGNNGTSLDVINKTGTLLPSTGGIGTTIFYAIGGALVVGAGILLFVKKRMGSKS